MRSRRIEQRAAANVVILLIVALMATGAIVWALALHRRLEGSESARREAEDQVERAEQSRGHALDLRRQQEEEVRELKSERAGSTRAREKLERELRAREDLLEHERSLRIAEAADRTIAQDPGLGLRLAVTARELADTAAARGGLARAMAANHEIAVVENAQDLLLAPDGKTLAIRLADALVLTRAGDGSILGRVADLAEEGRMAFSPDSARIVFTTRGVELAIATTEDLSIRQRIKVDSRVTDIAFDAAATQVLLGTTDRAAWLFDLASGERKKVFVGHGGAVLRALFVDEETIATFADDNILRFFERTSGDRLREIQNAGRPDRTRLLPAPKVARLLLVDDGNRTVDVVDTRLGEIAFSARLSDEAAANESAAAYLLSGLGPRPACVLALDGTALFRVSGDRRKVLRLDLAGDGSWTDFHDAGEGLVVRLIERGFLVKEPAQDRFYFLEPGTSPVPLASLPPTSGLEVAADGSLLAWGLAGKVELIRPDGGQSTLATGMRAIERALRPAGGGATVVLGQGRVSWQGDEATFPPRLLAAPPLSSERSPPRIWLSPDRALVLAAQTDGRARLIRLADGATRLEVGEKGLTVAAAAFAARAPLLALTLGTREPLVDAKEPPPSRLLIYDLEKLECLHDEEIARVRPSDPLWPGLDLSADGNLVFLRTTSDTLIRTWRDKTLEHRIWAWGTGTACFAPEGALAAASSFDGLTVVDRFTGETVDLPEAVTAPGGTCAFLPDGGSILVNADGGPCLIDLHEKGLRHRFGGGDLRLDLRSISPDGRRAVAATIFDQDDERHEIRFLDLAQGLIGPPIKLAHRCSLAAWSADAARVAITSDGLPGLHVLEAATGRTLLAVPELPAVQTEFTADGENLLVMRRDGALLRLPLDPLAAARERGLPGLSAAERERFLLPPAAEED